MSDYPMLISNKLHSFRNFPRAKIHLLSGNGEQIRKRIATDHAKHTTVYFISHPAKVVPCPVYPVKVRPLAGLAERKSSSPDGCGIFFRQTLRVLPRDSQAGEK